VSADSHGWSARIGDEAAGLIGRAAVIRLASVGSGLLFVFLEIAFQLANYYRPGIEAPVIFLVAFVFGWFYGYDGQGRRISATNPDGRVTTTAYDPAGRIITVKDPADAVTTNTIDPGGQVTAVSYSDGGSSMRNADSTLRRACCTLEVLPSEPPEGLEG
jgi:YD repeat-containing protein